MALFKYFSKSPASGIKKNGGTSIQFVEGGMVWAKLEDFPWWPGMICKNPKSRKFVDHHEVHVQFFGSPPTRSWILKKNIQTFKSKKPDDDKEVIAAYKEALEASKLLPKERLQEYYAAGVSDDEDDAKNNNTESDNKENELRKGKRNLRTVRPTSRKRIKMSVDSDYSDDCDGDDDDDDDDGDKKRKKLKMENDKDDSYELKVEAESSTSDEEMVSEQSDSEDEIPVKKSKVHTPKIKNNKNGATKIFSTPVGSNTKKASPWHNTSTNSTPPNSSNKLNTSRSRAQSALAQFSSPSNNPPPSPLTVVNEDGQQYVHFTLDFMKDGKRKDAKGKLHTDPEYDGRTLLVPKSFIDSKEVTPGMKQWWTLKSKMYDTIIFFKVGKFYEFYHMDAVIGVKELGLLYMRGKFAHCGFPEVAFSRYSDVLVQRGYKVARVEQTETPQALSARGGGKVVRREVCAVITKGTRTYGVMEGHCDDVTAAYLLAFIERPCMDGKIGDSVFGVCFVDTSIGKFHLGQFVDDRQCSRFLTMISQFPPAQVLFERNGVSPKVKHILDHELLSTIKESLVPGSEFWDSSKTLKFIAEQNYFNDDENSAGPTEWPPLLDEILKEGDVIGLQAPRSYEHAISALGACTWYLKKCCIEQELLSMSQFLEYVPSDNVTTTKKKSDNTTFTQNMILDGVALTNLDVIRNEEGGTEGTLLELLDHCSTSFGKRYFTQWLCSPSCNKPLIEARLNAVEDLMENSSVMEEARAIMRTIPDLARILRRIHTIGSFRRSQDHPESRAVYFNDVIFRTRQSIFLTSFEHIDRTKFPKLWELGGLRDSKKKIADLLAAIDGFKKVLHVVKTFEDVIESFSSSVLKKLLTLNTNNEAKSGFPDLLPTLRFFEDAFDHQSAKDTGNIHPKPGVMEEYDTSMADVESVKQQFNLYLKQQKKRLGVQNLTFWGTGKNRYQLEVPESALRSSTPDDYYLKSQKKGFKRFYTNRIEELLEALTSAEERRDDALKDTMRNIFNKFDKKYELWEKAVRCLATLDCLMSLAFYSQNIGNVSCRPEIVDACDADGNKVQPFIELRNCRHPCASLTSMADDFIPNDILLGIDENGEQETRHCILLTGPNMGGKSTLMRQAGVLLIMAQLGCYVPAEVCRFTPVDRVFTRLGARDRILHGESTFFVELSETSTIFQHATKHSLVLLDELGRGTATYDGTAIASAVVHDLASRLKCRTFFSTHYHSLVDDFSTNPGVKLGHMACMVEKDEEDVDDPTEENITFLYKLTEGACPKSYGFNAAKLAGLPISIIKNAHNKATIFEEATRNLRQLRAIFNSSSEDFAQKLSILVK